MKTFLLTLALLALALTGCSRTPWVPPAIPHTAPSGGTKPNAGTPVQPDLTIFPIQVQDNSAAGRCRAKVDAERYRYQPDGQMSDFEWFNARQLCVYEETK